MMKIIIKESEYTKQVMHNAIAHHQLTDTQFDQSSYLALPGSSPQFINSTVPATRKEKNTRYSWNQDTGEKSHVFPFVFGSQKP